MTMTFDEYVRESLKRIEREQLQIKDAIEKQGDKLEVSFRAEVWALDRRVSRNSDEIGKLDKALTGLRSKFLLIASAVGAIVGAAVAFAMRLIEHQVIG